MYIIIVPREQRKTHRRVTKMTREENIIRELNKAEQRLKKAILDHNDAGRDEQIYYINGMVKMAIMLGYSLITSVEVENIDGYWIEEYLSIEDAR